MQPGAVLGRRQPRVGRRCGEQRGRFVQPRAWRWAGPPRLRRAVRGLGCRHLPVDSERFSSHVKYVVIISYKPSVHLRGFFFFFFFNCRVLRLCQKALLRQNEMFREEKKKNNPNLLLFDL